MPQSGAAHTLLPRADAAKIARRFCAALGADSIADVIGAPVDRILDAQVEIEGQSLTGDLRPPTGLGLGGMPFQPVIDGHLLSQPPLSAVQGGLSSEVAVLVGTNRDEMTLFPLGMLDEQRLHRIAARVFTDADVA